MKLMVAARQERDFPAVTHPLIYQPGASVRTIDSAHSPFFPHPEKLAGIIASLL